MVAINLDLLIWKYYLYFTNVNKLFVISCYVRDKKKYTMKQWLAKIVSYYQLVVLLHQTSFEDLNEYILLKIKLEVIEEKICKVIYLMICN